MKKLGLFPDVLENAVHIHSPHLLAEY